MFGYYLEGIILLWFTIKNSIWFWFLWKVNLFSFPCRYLSVSLALADALVSIRLLCEWLRDTLHYFHHVDLYQSIKCILFTKALQTATDFDCEYTQYIPLEQPYRHRKRKAKIRTSFKLPKLRPNTSKNFQQKMRPSKECWFTSV